MQGINKVIEVFPEKKDYEVLMSAEIRQKMGKSGAGIDQLVNVF